MFTLKRLIVTSLFVFVLAGPALAQENGAPIDNPQPTVPNAPLVTAAASGKRVRFVSPGTVVQLRLEVYNEAGQKVFDTELRGGNVLDWHLQDGAGERLTAGSYACVLTVKSLSGRLSQRTGTVTVGDKNAEVHPANVRQISNAQQQAIGPVEGDSGFTVLQENQEAIAAVTHDGTDGQLTRSRGAVSFRFGDFFSGRDQEQMRLTEEGNLGIGTSTPQARLDVVGAVRASEGFRFTDGTTLTAKNGKLSVTNSSGETIDPKAAGTGTQNRLAKWNETGGAGTLTDSLLEESGLDILHRGRSIQMTAVASPAIDTNLLYLDATNKTTGVLAGNVPSFVASSGPYFAMRGNNYTAIANQRGLFSISAGNVSSPTGIEGAILFLTGADQLRMIVKPSGNVGVGTNDPLAKLHVAGTVNFTGLRTEATLIPNVIGGQSANGVTMGVSAATIGGGGAGPNRVTDNFGTVGGGSANRAGDNAGTVSDRPAATVGGGSGNIASGTSSTVGGGNRNTASGESSTVPGGQENVSQGSFSFAAGNRAQALHLGSFVWSDSTTADPSFFSSTADNQFLINATGGVGIGTNAPQRSLSVNAALNIDQADANNGTVNPGLTFGFGSGEGIASKRTPGGNLFGLDFYTASQNRMSITNAGNVGIGTTDPMGRLHVGGSVIADDLNVDGNTLTVDPFNNRVGIGTTAPVATLDVDGTLRVGTLGAASATHVCRDSSLILSACSSSLRYKERVANFGSGLDVVSRLRPVIFNWKESRQPDVGLIAEEVNRVAPLFVTHNSQGQIEGVKYDQLSVVLINAVREQQTQIEQQSEQLKRQQNLIEGLKKLVCRDHPNADVCR